MLYILNKLYSADKLETCLLRAGETTNVLLIEDAVYAVKSNSQTAKVIERNLPRITVSAVAPDLVTRGIAKEEVLPGIVLVSYHEFVELTVHNEVLQFWF